MAEAAHEHAFPCNPPGGTLWDPGPCTCGKTYAQAEADRLLAGAVAALRLAYGTVMVFTRWTATHCHGACAGQFDGEDDARSHLEFYAGGTVARETVITLPWASVPAPGLEAAERHGSETREAVDE